MSRSVRSGVLIIGSLLFIAQAAWGQIQPVDQIQTETPEGKAVAPVRAYVTLQEADFSKLSGIVKTEKFQEGRHLYLLPDDIYRQIRSIESIEVEFVSPSGVSVTDSSSGEGAPVSQRAGDEAQTNSAVRSKANGSCKSYNASEKFRQGDECKNVFGADYSVNGNDLSEEVTSSYVALGPGYGKSGGTDYQWRPPQNLTKASFDVTVGIEDNLGTLDIYLWDVSGRQWKKVGERKNRSFLTSPNSISVSSKNSRFIDGGYLAIQFRTDDGWWIDDIQADWTEAVPKIRVSPGQGSYPLGQVTVGQTETQRFTVENTGDDTLVAEPTLTGSDTNQFTITNATSLSLAPGEDHTFDIEYAPDETGTHSVMFELSHNGENVESPWEAFLQGEGEPRPEPALRVSPGQGSYPLGQVTVGQTETQRFTVENTGDDTLVAEPTLTGSDTNQFTITNATSLSLAPGEDHTFDIEYAPDETGTHSVMFELSHNGENVESPWEAFLQGEGESRPATLNLRVENVAGGSTDVPGSNGIVELYDADDTLIGETLTEAVGDGSGAGIASFTGLDASKTYRAEIYHDPGNASALGSQEYWGKKTNLSVVSGTTTDATFTRYMPYISEPVRFFDAAGNDVTGTAVPPGTDLTARVVLRNNGGAVLGAPRLVLDRDRTAGYDVDRTADVQSLPTGSPQTFELTFTPSTAGTYYFAYEAAVTSSSLNDPVTDGSTWSAEPGITIGQPGSDPEVLTAELAQHTPSSLYPRTYSIETRFADPDGATDLREVSLEMVHPSGATLGLKKNVLNGAEETTSGASHFSFDGASAENMTQNEVKVTWTFTLNDSWPAVTDGIEYRLGVTDQVGRSASPVAAPVTASYKDVGTTVITHGMQFPVSGNLDEGLTTPDDRLSKWLMDMACRIQSEAGGGQVLVYDIQSGTFVEPSRLPERTSITGNFYEDISDSYSNNCFQYSSTGETVLIFDWTIDSNDRGLGFSESAADALYASLRMREARADLGRLHLIGHSRGTAVMSEVTERLLSTNINVDQVTYLDPHDWGFPLEAIGGSPDDELAILPDNDVNEDLSIGIPSSTPVINGTKNNGVVGWGGSSLWVEAYYQTNGGWDAITTKRYKDGNCYSDNGGKLDGRPVRGASSTNWTSEYEEYEEGEGDGECPLSHSGVVREYIRSVEGSNDAPGGYQYSRIGGFAHLRPDRTSNGPTVEPRYDPENLGRGITNGDFERGNSCFSPLSVSGARSGTVPGWSYHGGSTDAAQLGLIDYYGALVSTEEGQHLQLGGTVTKWRCNLRTERVPLIPAGDVAVHNRFYIPENTSSISFTYHVQSPSSDDEIRVSLGDASGDNFQEKFSEVPDKRLTALRNVPVDGFAGTVATLKVELVRGNAVVGVDNFRINLGNAPPVASTPISNQTLTAREAAFEANLSSVFSDPDDSALSFSASSSDDGIASAAVSGETLTVTPLAAGTATITVEASDGTSDPGTTTFDVQVLKTDQRPDPVITSIESPPLQVELGKSFTIQLEAENQGDPANYGSITFSFPQLNKERDIEAVRLSSGSTSDDTPGYVKKAAGEEIFDRNSDPMTAQYLLVEYGDDNWRGGESNTLHLTVTPQEIGTFDVYARATFGINNEFVSTPATASTTDQQQWPVERFTLEVVEPRVAAPTDLTANAGESDVTLSWSASADSNVAGYNVYRSTRLFNTPGEATKLNSDPLPNLSYIDNNVTEATSYVYRVTAVAADDTESGLSDAANATVGGGGVNAPPEAIADTYTAAAGETLAVDAGRGVLANDTDPDGDDLTARLISDVSNGTLTLSDDGAFTYTPNDGFIGEDAFTYAARDGNGGSAEANVTFAVEEEDATPPAAPIDLAATATGAQIDLSWTASAEEDVAGYHVYRAETSFSDPADATKLTSSLLTDVSYVDTDVTGGTTYVYRVTATDDAGSESDLSAEASATLSETVTRSVAVVEGWNLRSVPVETDDMTLAGTFASCESAFRFTPGSGYASLGDAALSVGQGGFFNCSSGTVDLTGTPAASSVDVAAGWNLIGPQAEPVEVASITTEPVGLIESLFFGFAPDAGYASAETLEPTFGYWVKASAAGTIHMDGSGATTAATQAGPAAAPDGSLQEKPLRDAVRLVLTDATGRRQTLYLDAALTEDERSRFALPPVPPGDLFDVRFASGGIAETLAAPSGDRTAATTEATAPDPPAPDAHRVDLQGVTFPVTVRVADRAGQAEEAGSGRLRLEDPVHGHSLYLSEEAPEAVLQGPTDRVLVGLESVPEAYALGASYPNPASQRVTIEYALPEATEVTVEVYDLLGRRVLQAVGGQKAAGRHTVHLDARRLPSGTYFYRMRAGDFTAAKRLVVVR